MGDPTLRERFLEEAARLVRAAGSISGVRRIAVIGSVVTDKLDPEDLDLLVTVTDDADLARGTSDGHASGATVGLEFGWRAMRSTAGDDRVAFIVDDGAPVEPLQGVLDGPARCARQRRTRQASAPSPVTHAVHRLWYG
jgi:hypothetical protein